MDIKQRLHKIRKIVFFLLPFILLYLIFQRVDFSELMVNLKKTIPLYIVLGLGFRPFQILLGGYRWGVLNNYYCKSDLTRRYILRHYWTGLAMGYFTSGNVGWDAYRVITIGNKITKYIPVIVGIFAEKFIGLFSLLIVGLVTFPLVRGHIRGDISLYNMLYLLLLAGFLCSVFFLYLMTKRHFQRLTDLVKMILDKYISKIMHSVKLGKFYQNITLDYSASNSFFSILHNPRLLFSSIVLSLVIITVGAVSTQLIFLGLEYPIPFSVNLFAGPVFLFLLILPLPFGGLGVREGAYVLFYSQFGVPLEIALLVSFFNLFGMVINHIIGAVIMWFNR